MEAFDFKHRDIGDTVYTVHYDHGGPIPEDVVIVTWGDSDYTGLGSNFTYYNRDKADKFFDNGTWVKC